MDQITIIDHNIVGMGLTLQAWHLYLHNFKLLAALGAWLGPLMLPLIILLSSLVGAIIGIILLKIRKENQPFAFGPYLAIAGWIALIWGNQLMTIYLGNG